jgi:hypothetical protein
MEVPNDELRWYLKTLVDERSRARAAREAERNGDPDRGNGHEAESKRVLIKCEGCGTSYEISDRRAREARLGRAAALCPECRRVGRSRRRAIRASGASASARARFRRWVRR